VGWRFRKIWRSGPFRWTLSKRGVGWSCGVPGFRYGVSPSGQRYISVGIPGTGLYWIKYFGKQRDVGDAAPPAQAQRSEPEKPVVEPWWKNQIP